MKASDFNKTPGQQPQMTRERRPASFTGDHLVKIVKSVVNGISFCLIIYFFINFAKWGIEFGVTNKLIPFNFQSDSTKIQTIPLDTLKNESK